LRDHRGRRKRKPALGGILGPSAFRHVAPRPLEVTMTRLRAGEIHGAARSPAMHHRSRHAGMKLEPESVAEP